MKKAYSYAMRNYMSIAVAAAAVLVIAAAVVIARGEIALGAVQGVIGVALFAHLMILGYKRKRDMVRYLRLVTKDETGLSENVLMSVPMPMAVCGIDGTVRWYNDKFSSIFGGTLPYEILDDMIPELKWSDVLKNQKGKGIITELAGRIYSARWFVLRENRAQDDISAHYSVFFYLTDITREKQLEETCDKERADIAIINIDNYDDFSQKSDDDAMEAVCSKIRAAINVWAKKGRAVVKKTDSDRFFVVLEHGSLQGYIDEKFDVVENVRKAAEEAKIPLSISIGIGTGGNIEENETAARNALDMALGRGGDQVCIKDSDQFRFYAGKNREYERSTKVKARAVAVALEEYIKGSDNVIMMGHRAADFDCFGAAIGLQRAVREHGKTPYIVRERVSPAIDKMYNAIKGIDEYSGMFVDENEVLEEVTPDSLLVILDTHRPSMLPCPKLLERVSKIILIDHHRRSTEFVSPCSLIYHEPYASSTCEMVTELLEYMSVGSKLTKTEAQCLYTGILMDTKNFILKTGVRTFEAASYLRKLGLDTVRVRKMFSTSIEDYAMKAEIVETARMAADGIAVAYTENSHRNIRVIASQAADDMLNLNDVSASVVVYPMNGGAGVSARSLGTINVQLITEKLGGGGHMTVSGAQLKGKSVPEGVRMVTDAIRVYAEESK
ncbi:MAG TPA: DHH family phosphoesterase [Candidatus Ornithomonoglobus merdipullorum]|uniref:Cyclic-di-AMP phosphodiesterase n=1 Tax=Candidatus Ornithomonoglobus merdipullorum TaxID=2840895 RepID=A0A9D1MBI3_9FIRM|nr:DHH family phosphoesterase [Candidatus Ornithomonoglobus merdipullorum]